MVPEERVTVANAAPLRSGGDYVLYWMIAQRRTTSNFGLQRAAERARALKVPLLVLEALRSDYPWVSPRLHRFVVDGMADNARACAKAGVRYYAYLEPKPGAGRGLLAALAERACLVVTDRFPCFFLPGMVAAAAEQLPVCLEEVDGNGLLPLAAAERAFPTAYAFRRFLQRNLRDHLQSPPDERPLRLTDGRARVARAVSQRWPELTGTQLSGDLDALIASLQLARPDGPAAVAGVRGGARAAATLLDRFVDARLQHYSDRNQPEVEVCTELSAHLHFGHIGAAEIVQRITDAEDWAPDRLAATANGKREGWWGMSAEAEAVLDQVVTWRELGYVFCDHRPDYAEFAALPEWARATLAQHADDPREHCYSLDEFDAAATHDGLWNAAQNQLRREGRIHNYLRMLWGKKILEWSRSPEAALAIMIELNNRYALDGRNPNSYSGIGWVLGRFDRPWAPERPIFGRVRYMSSANTRRKLRVKHYETHYGKYGV